MYYPAIFHLNIFFFIQRLVFKFYFNNSLAYTEMFYYLLQLTTRWRGETNVAWLWFRGSSSHLTQLIPRFAPWRQEQSTAEVNPTWRIKPQIHKCCPFLVSIFQRRASSPLIGWSPGGGEFETTLHLLSFALGAPAEQINGGAYQQTKLSIVGCSTAHK